MNHKSNVFLTLIMLMLLLTISLIPAGSTNSWEINTVDQGSSSIIIGADPTIQLDKNNQIHIVYRETIDETNHILKYAKRINTTGNERNKRTSVFRDCEVNAPFYFSYKLKIFCYKW